MNRRIVSTVMTAAMVATMLATTVSAEENKVVKIAIQGDSLTWQQEIVDKFQEETGYTVEPILIPADQDMYTKTMHPTQEVQPSPLYFVRHVCWHPLYPALSNANQEKHHNRIFL